MQYHTSRSILIFFSSWRSNDIAGDQQMIDGRPVSMCGVIDLCISVRRFYSVAGVAFPFTERGKLYPILPDGDIIHGIDKPEGDTPGAIEELIFFNCCTL